MLRHCVCFVHHERLDEGLEPCIKALGRSWADLWLAWVAFHRLAAVHDHTQVKENQKAVHVRQERGRNWGRERETKECTAVRKDSQGQKHAGSWRRLLYPNMLQLLKSQCRYRIRLGNQTGKAKPNVLLNAHSGHCGAVYAILHVGRNVGQIGGKGVSRILPGILC